jgi:hypothetical protein
LDEGCSIERELGRERRKRKRREKIKEKEKRKGKSWGRKFKKEEIRNKFSSFISPLFYVFLIGFFSFFFCPFLIIFIQRGKAIEQN